MSGQYVSQCGCRIHVFKWSSESNTVYVDRCSLHKSAGELLAAAKALSEEIHDWQNVPSLKAMEDLRAAIVKAEEKS
jgi:hypothetical protein